MEDIVTLEICDEADKVLVVGVGGGGCNAIDYMLSKEIKGVQYLSINTDAQALRSKKCDKKLQIGKELTRGLGAGAKPEIGKNAAIESLGDLQKELRGYDIVFLTAGMGGGTGTGATPIIARLANEMNIVTVGVVTRPFLFEMRDDVANKGLVELAKYTGSLIVIQNEKLKALYKNFPFLEAFAKADEVLYESTRGITELITNAGNINIDIADIKTVFLNKGLSTIGVGAGFGKEKATEAFNNAISSPLIETNEVSAAKGIIATIACGLDFSLEDYDSIGKKIHGISTEDADIIIGTSIDPDLGDELRLTLIVNGII